MREILKLNSRLNITSDIEKKDTYLVSFHPNLNIIKHQIINKTCNNKIQKNSVISKIGA